LLPIQKIIALTANGNQSYNSGHIEYTNGQIQHTGDVKESMLQLN